VSTNQICIFTSKYAKYTKKDSEFLAGISLIFWGFRVVRGKKNALFNDI